MPKAAAEGLCNITSAELKDSTFGQGFNLAMLTLSRDVQAEIYAYDALETRRKRWRARRSLLAINRNIARFCRGPDRRLVCGRFIKRVASHPASHRTLGIRPPRSSQGPAACCTMLPCNRQLLQPNLQQEGKKCELRPLT